MPEAHSPSSRLGTTARTGERCPESGVWRVAGTPSTTAPIAQHNVMPPVRRIRLSSGQLD